MDHLALIDKCMGDLVTRIDLKNTVLWERLVEKKIIEQHDVEYIKVKKSL